MRFLESLMRSLGYVRASHLDYDCSVAKRLNEHRELVEIIEHKTSLLKEEWNVRLLATQDDYLMRLYYLRHGDWPEGPNRFIYPRSPSLGKCALPEYPAQDTIEKMTGSQG